MPHGGLAGNILRAKSLQDDAQYCQWVILPGHLPVPKCLFPHGMGTGGATVWMQSVSMRPVPAAALSAVTWGWLLALSLMALAFEPRLWTGIVFPLFSLEEHALNLVLQQGSSIALTLPL